MFSTESNLVSKKNQKKVRDVNARHHYRNRSTHQSVPLVGVSRLTAAHRQEALDG